MTPTEEVEAVALAVTAVAFALIAWAVAAVLLRAARREPRVLVVIALTLLTLIALLAAAVSDSTELLTLTATGFGALAGAVTSLFQDPGGPDEPDR